MARRRPVPGRAMWVLLLHARRIMHRFVAGIVIARPGARAPARPTGPRRTRVRASTGSRCRAVVSPRLTSTVVMNASSAVLADPDLAPTLPRGSRPADRRRPRCARPRRRSGSSRSAGRARTAIRARSTVLRGGLVRSRRLRARRQTLRRLAAVPWRRIGRRIGRVVRRVIRGVV